MAGREIVSTTISRLVVVAVVVVVMKIMMKALWVCESLQQCCRMCIFG